MESDSGTVFIVDDDADVCQSIKFMVQSMGLAVDSFGSAEQFLKSVVDEPYGCLITDIRMLGMSGLQLLKEIAAMNWDLPVIVITGFGDVRMAVESFKAGAFTFLEKPYRDQELWDAIVEALAKSNAKRIERGFKQETKACLGKLTPDEIVVLRELLDSTPLKAIATKLNLSLRTIDLRRKSILNKFKVETNIELTKLIVTSGIPVSEI